MLYAGPTALAGTLTTSAEAFAVGSKPAGLERWLGTIDEVTVCGTAISAAEAAALHAKATGVSARVISHYIGGTTYQVALTPTAAMAGVPYISESADSFTVHSTDPLDDGGFDWAIVSEAAKMYALPIYSLDIIICQYSDGIYTWGGRWRPSWG